MHVLHEGLIHIVWYSQVVDGHYRGTAQAYRDLARTRLVYAYPFATDLAPEGGEEGYHDDQRRLLDWLVANRLSGGIVRPEPDDAAVEDYDPDTGEWVVDLDRLRAKLTGEVKAEAESRRATLLTLGATKQMVYDAKADELRQWDALGNSDVARAAEVGSWSEARRAATFPFASAESAVSGATFLTAIERMRAGAVAANAGMGRIEAVEQMATRAIAVAGDAEAARSAANPDWSQSAPA